MKKTETKTPRREVLKNFSKVVLEIEKRDTKLMMLRGRATLDRMSDKNEFYFIEDAPRGKRSREIGRTLHSRTVQRTDGDFTVTFRIRAGDKNLKYWMQSEARDVVKMIESV